MILTCPACATRYTVRDDSVSSRARKVRCVKCTHEWVIEPAETAEVIVEDAAEDAALAAEPADEVEAAPEAAATPSSEVTATVRKRLAAKAPVRPRFPVLDRFASLGIALVLLLSVSAAVLALRTPIARAWPPAAGLYAALGFKVNVIGIEIRNTNWQIARQNGLPVLTVSGEVINVTGHELAVPHLRLTLRDDKARTLYEWSAVLKAKRLKPGEAAQFTETRQSPPLEAHDVEIRFETGA